MGKKMIYSRALLLIFLVPLVAGVARGADTLADAAQNPN